MYESDDKMVSHPSHYQSETGLEVIDVIEAFTFDLKGIEATDTGNIIKYACRWKNKNGIANVNNNGNTNYNNASNSNGVRPDSSINQRRRRCYPFRKDK